MDNAKIIGLISDLIAKAQTAVPERGDFGPVYSECRIEDRNLCLTDVMLKVEPVPSHIEHSEDQRYLTCVGYKIPAPIKSSSILFKGNKDTVLDLLRQESLIERIRAIIERLDYNLMDV